MPLMDFAIMATPPTNVNTPKKVISPLPKKVQKLRERVSSDLEIVDHFLETDGLAKPATPKNSVKENRVKFTRKWQHTIELLPHKVSRIFNHLLL